MKDYEVGVRYVDLFKVMNIMLIIMLFVNYLQLYDLHIGRVGQQQNSEDGCPREDITCGLNDVEGPRCGVNGTCIGSLNRNELQCVCKPGSRGPGCELGTLKIK